jgi:hypothetical protein
MLTCRNSRVGKGVKYRIEAIAPSTTGLMVIARWECNVRHNTDLLAETWQWILVPTPS